MSLLKRHSSTPLIRTAGPVVSVALAVVGCILVANALASNGAHRSHRARRASTVGALVAPSGAVLAATNGASEAFVSHNSEGEICVTTITQGNSAAEGGCGQPASVEAEGLVGFGIGGKAPKITVLAPNGVTAVTVTNHDGSTQVLPVTNGVALGDATNAATVSYSTPSHGPHTTAIVQK